MKKLSFIIALTTMATYARLGIGEEKQPGTTPEEAAQVKENDTPPEGPPSAGDKKSSKKVKLSFDLNKLNRQIDTALEEFSHEPHLEELQRAALTYLDADRETAKRWRKAPRRAALLPAIKFVVDHDLERDESLDRYQDEPDRWGADSDRDLGFQVSAQWKLDELVFNSDEVRVWGALADRASRRETLLTVLVGYYFERRRLQLKELLAPPVNLAEMAETKLRIAELTASIDALTGGLLTRALKNTEKK
ncbi:MAG: hypothetical protein GY847_15945 [Proteobacteria bacterium]|nr:hypothetical protein [Pseudomonadota bacterium]